MKQEICDSARPLAIALIDSGINPWHSHVGSCAGGVGIRCGEDGTPVVVPDWSDRLGHGTCLAAILRLKCPDLPLWSVKIFFESLSAPAAALALGIRWSVDQGIRIIQCSLGSEDPRARELLQPVCLTAIERGAIVVAAQSRGGSPSFPASFPGLIAVESSEKIGWDEIGSRNDCLLAHPYPREIPGVPKERNFHGPSVAAAHVTARIARILAARPDLTLEEVRQELRPCIPAR